MPTLRKNRTLEDKLCDEARLGFTQSYQRLSKDEVKNLQSQGFALEQIHNDSGFTKTSLYKVSWANANAGESTLVNKLIMLAKN